MSVIPTAPLGISTGSKELSELQEPEKLRQYSVSAEHTGIRQRLWGLEARLDPTVTLEEYEFWAKIEREMEAVEHRQYMAKVKEDGFKGYIKAYFTSKIDHEVEAVTHEAAQDAASAAEKTPEGADKTSVLVNNDSGLTPLPPKTHDIDAEWRRAARALRTSGWVTVFYLITTDILGWGQTPYVFSSCGFGLASGVFIIFGLAAAASGMMIWKVFLALDSSRYPVLSFGDPFFRLFGPKTRNFINVTQALQMWCSVCVVLMGNSQILSQLAKAKVCYIAIVIINMIIGMISGALRSLKHIGWLCNFAVWFNIVSFIIICAAAGTNGPDVTLALQTTLLKTAEPVKTFVGTPPAQYQQQTHDLFAAKFSGIDSVVYAYSGALLFVAFLSEMRHPMDFWKGCLLAQTFILVVYVFFGAFVYHYFGQYSITSISQVVSPYGLQLVSNILALVTGYLAIFLYFNIGMKTVYLEVGQEILGLPPISSKKGYYYWLALGPLYWIIALVVAVSVPNFTSITNLIGGLLSLNFTYSIPAIMYVAWIIQHSAKLPGEGFDPYTGVTTRHDDGVKRWIRGVKNSWYLSIPAIAFAMAGLASSGMGSWSAIQSLKEIFGPGGTIQTSWSCTAVG